MISTSKCVKFRTLANVGDSMYRAALLFAFFAIVSHSVPLLTSAQAAGVQLGPLCVEGAVLLENETDKTIQGDGYWYPITLSYGKPGTTSKPARIDLFDRPLPKTAGLLSCNEMISLAKAQGVNLIFSGRLDKLDLAGEFFKATAPNDNRLQIKPGKFSADITSVTTGTIAINGGTISMKGSKLHIDNPSQFLGGATILSGAFELTLWDRKISNLRMVVPGGATIQANFSSKDSRKPFDVRINMVTRQADLWAGTLVGSPSGAMVGSAATIAGLSLTNPNATIGTANLTASNGKIAAHIENVKGKADKLIWKQKTIVTALDRPTFQWKKGSGTAISTSSQINLALPLIEDAVFKSPATILGSDAQTELLSGAIQANFATLSETNIDGKLSWIAPESPSLRFIIPPKGLTSATLFVKGGAVAPQISGNFDVNQLSLGGMLLKQALSLKFDTAKFDSQLRIPIKFDVKDKSAQFTLSDRDQKALITAGLRRAFLDSVLIIDLQDLAKSYLDVPENGFELTLFSMVATQPFIAGTIPAFGDAEVSAVNPTRLSIGIASTGHVDISPKLLIIGEPIVRIGHKGSESRAGLKMEANGGATFAFDFATGTLSLAKADFEIKDADFRLLDSEGIVDISGIEITDPEIKLTYLKINYDQQGPIKIGAADGNEFSFNGTRINKPSDPAKPNEIVYDASLQRAFTIKEFHALQVKIDKVLSFDLIDVKNVDIAMVSANARFGDGFRIKNASISLSVDELATIRLDDATLEKFDNARFVADGAFNPGNTFSVNNDPSFHVGLNVSGFGTTLKGSGDIKIGAFSGSKQAEAEIDFPCHDGKKPKLSLEYNFALTGVSATVAVDEGHFDASTSIGPLVLVLHTKSGVGCNGKGDTITLVPEHDLPVPPYPCGGTFLAPEFCTTITIPAVRGNYHLRYEVLFSGGSIELTDALVKLETPNTKVCNKGLIDASKLVVVPNVYPQIDDYVPGLTEATNLIAQASFVVPETVLATSITTGVGLLASTTLSGIGKVGCF